MENKKEKWVPTLSKRKDKRRVKTINKIEALKKELPVNPGWLRIFNLVANGIGAAVGGYLALKRYERILEATKKPDPSPKPPKKEQMKGFSKCLTQYMNECDNCKQQFCCPREDCEFAVNSDSEACLGCVDFSKYLSVNSLPSYCENCGKLLKDCKCEDGACWSPDHEKQVKENRNYPKKHNYPGEGCTKCDHPDLICSDCEKGHPSSKDYPKHIGNTPYFKNDKDIVRFGRNPDQYRVKCCIWLESSDKILRCPVCGKKFEY